MTGRRLLGCALLLIAACTPRAEEQVQATNAQAATPAAQVSHEELFGQWRLVEMPGLAAGEDPQIHVLIGRYGIEAVSQCITFGKVMPGARLPEVTKPPRMRPEPVCARTLSPRERIFGPALASVRTVERLADGRVVLRGEKGDLVLERVEEPVLNPLQNAPGPGPYLMWGEWRVSAIDGKAPREPMSLLFFRNRMELGSGCVHFGRHIEQEGATLRLSPDPTVTTICERMTSEEEDAAERILSGSVSIAESASTRRLLRGSGGRLLVER